MRAGTSAIAHTYTETRKDSEIKRRTHTKKKTKIQVNERLKALFTDLTHSEYQLANTYSENNPHHNHDILHANTQIKSKLLIKCSPNALSALRTKEVMMKIKKKDEKKM